MSALKAATAKKLYSIEDYIEQKNSSAGKTASWEHRLNEAPEHSLVHNRLATRLITHLSNQLADLEGVFEVFSCCQQVFLPQDHRIMQPDAVVVRDRPETLLGQPSLLVNPALIVEIVPFDEDGGSRFFRYKSISSLDEYVLVAEDSHRVISFRRTGPQQWQESEAVGREGRLELKALGIELELEAIYRGVELS